MTIKIYKNLSDKNHVDKDITQVGSNLTGVFREDTPITAPSIVIESYTGFSLKTCNYCYIPEFGRYYYITDIIALTDVLFELRLRVDVLMTYKDQIRNNTAIVSRQANSSNLYLPDGVFKTKPYSKYEILKYGGGFDDFYFVLAVAGG